MTDEELKRYLQSSIASRSWLGPEDADEEPMVIPAQVLKEALLSVSEERDPGWLRMRNSRITGPLDLSNCDLLPGISLHQCIFENRVDFSQAHAVHLGLTACSFQDQVSLDQFEVKWNLDFTASDFAAGISLYGVKAGGQLSLRSISCVSGEPRVPAIAADDVEVGTDLFCGQAEIKGGIAIENARIGGQFELLETTLASSQGEGSSGNCFKGDGMSVGGGLFADGLEAEGEFRLIDACIDGIVSLAGAKIEGGENAEGGVLAFSADRADLSGSLRAHGIQVTGEVRMLAVKLGGQLSMDRAEIAGEFLLLGATIAGELGLAHATLDGEGRPALSADRIKIGSGMFCQGLKAKGEVRLSGAEIRGQLMMLEAELDGAYGLNRDPVALNANGMSTSDAVLCQRLDATGGLTFNSARVKGGITFDGARLKSGSGPPALNLLGTHTDELVLRLAEVDGVVDLRYASVRTLWDGRNGDVELLKGLRLEGFDYQTLAEPLDAERRLKWLEPSQDGQYLPGVFVGLAESFRRIGHRGDARKVEIEAARRAIDQLPPWRPRWLWNKLLWITTGSGYRNWLAGMWLLGLLAAGSLIFWHCQSDFVPLTAHPPPFNPVLYAVDATVPVIEVGQQRAFAPTSSIRWLALFLTASGYALVTAVIAAVAGLLNPDHRA